MFFGLWIFQKIILKYCRLIKREKSLTFLRVRFSMILSIAMNLLPYPRTGSPFTFFLPVTIDISENISRYFNLVKLSPIDIEEDSIINGKDEISLNPSKLNINFLQKKIITKAIVEKMKLVADISNASIVRKAQCFCQEKNQMTAAAINSGLIRTVNCHWVKNSNCLIDFLEQKKCCY